jgi:hypothetical protein
MLRDVPAVTRLSQVSLRLFDLKHADYIRSTVAFVLQTISEALRSCGSFSVAFDVATTHTTTVGTLTSVFAPTPPARYRISSSSPSLYLNVIRRLDVPAF